MESKWLGTNSAEKNLGMSQVGHAIGAKAKKKKKEDLLYTYRKTPCEIYKIIFITYRYSQCWESISGSPVLGWCGPTIKNRRQH